MTDKITTELNVWILKASAVNVKRDMLYFRKKKEVLQNKRISVRIRIKVDRYLLRQPNIGINQLLP